ncbi:hypothetical protein G9A89_018020 [Geosiphon pyriformis]|nr:hypothetical protein G9A89_018020 [Geosiphon pyriformis]
MAVANKLWVLLVDKLELDILVVNKLAVALFGCNEWFESLLDAMNIHIGGCYCVGL